MPREPDHEYQIEASRRALSDPHQLAGGELSHRRGAARRDARSRALARCRAARSAKCSCNDFEVFRDFLAVSERSGGLLQHPRAALERRRAVLSRRGRSHLHDAARLESRARHHARCATCTRRSRRRRRRTTTTCAAAIGSCCKREPVLGDFDPASYTSELLWAPARDGERVPVSVVYRKDTPLDGTAPLYQYALRLVRPEHRSGVQLARGCRCSIAASSMRSRTCAADRSSAGAGTTPAACATNGTRSTISSMSRISWSRAATVRATACSRPAAARAVCSSASIANVAPERYRGLIAHVPFVDIVTTMLDESIPLTTLEYDEWGDPNERQYYEYMLSYSPYDNVRPQAYPAMLVTTGLWDSQVQYYEPAKWVAKLREREPRRPARAAARQSGGRPRRQVRPLRASARGRAGIRLHHQPRR